MLYYIILLVLMKGIPVLAIQINVCRYPNSSRVDYIYECCSDYYEVNHHCIECRPGTFGKNCRETCPSNYYGLGCKSRCNCSSTQICDRENGCVFENNNSTENSSSERPDVPEFGSSTNNDQGLSTLQVYLVMAGGITGIIFLTFVCVKSYQLTSVKCFNQRLNSVHQNTRNTQNGPQTSQTGNCYSPPRLGVNVHQEPLETRNINPEQDIYYEISEI